MAELYRTGRDTGERLARVAPGYTGASTASITVDPGEARQTLSGFGGAITEASAYTLSRLPEALRREALAACFDPAFGHGYTRTRLHINSCDFALENYDYIEAGDRSLSSFDMAREERWVLPALREAGALAGRPLSILASPWSPPGWMKTNGTMNNGGALLPECRVTWAAYLVRYLGEMASRGLRIDALTVQNEPAARQTWDSCEYSAEEERDFVKDHLGPALASAGSNQANLLIWDHNRDIILERVEAILSDPAAARYVWGVGHHWYVSEDFANLSRVHERFPQAHLVFTEGCQEGGVQVGAWFTGERYGRNIIGDLSNWVEGWIDWNIVLDETGGPNHVGNLCDAPIIADTRSGELHYNSSYWYIGHFARYMPPGSVCLSSTDDGAGGLAHLACRTPEARLAVVVMNATEVDHAVDVAVRGATSGASAGIELPAHSIATVLI